MGAPQRYSDGVTNIGKGKTLSEKPTMDPTKTYGYFNDFFTYEDGDWDIDATGGGTTAVSATEAGGVVVLTTDTTTEDGDFMQLTNDDGSSTGVPYLLVVGKKAWFKARFKVTEVTQAELILGLADDDTDFAVTNASDGIWFETLDGVETLDLVIAEDSLYTRVTGVATLVDDTFVVVGYYWDGIDTVHYFINDVEVGSVGVGTTLTDSYLALTWGAEAGSGAAVVLSLDYIGAWVER